MHAAATADAPTWSIIVAHHREQLDWLPSLLDGLQQSHLPTVHIYHKGCEGYSAKNTCASVSAYLSTAYAGYFAAYNGSFMWTPLENVGREVETFARHLHESYHDLTPMTAFIQGNPEHSDRAFNGTVMRELKHAMTHAPRGGEEIGQRPHCKLLGAPIVLSDGDGCPNHCGLAVSSTCARLAHAQPMRNLLSCAEPFEFVTGGMFYLSRATVHLNARSFYLAMHDMLYAEGRFKRRAPLYPYIYERLWPRLFNCSWTHAHARDARPRGQRRLSQKSPTTMPPVCWYPLTAAADGSRCPQLQIEPSGSSPRRPTAYPPGADAPCSAPLSSGCAKGSAPAAHARVAVCLAGGVRTLVRPNVARSLATNLLGGLAAHITDLFAVLRAADVAPKGTASQNEHASVAPASRAELTRALGVLAPYLRALVLDHEEVGDGGGGAVAYGTPYNPKCTLRGFMGRSVSHSMRSLAQPASWSFCMSLIEEAESRLHRGVQYEWVVRARPDAYWHWAHPPACALDARALYVHVWNDHHFVLPRRHAPPVMHEMIASYTRCDGVFAHETPERWLTSALLNAAGRTSWESLPCTSRAAAVGRDGTPPFTPRLHVRQLIFPFALVRASAHEPDAWMLCAQNYIVPYALANASASPCAGDHSDRALRRMHAALLACVRAAYPEETIDGGFHKAHMVLAMRHGACPDWLRRSTSPETSPTI